MSVPIPRADSGDDSGAIIKVQEVVLMPDILIRDLPEHVVAAIDANAQRLGLSRNEYLRRQLGTESRPHGTVTVADLKRSTEVFADINDPDVMSGAWS